MNITLKKYIIMDKERKVIAKGVPRHRYLVLLSNKNDKKRILYYDSKGRAEAGFKVSGFYANLNPETGDKYDLEAVEVEITIKEVL